MVQTLSILLLVSLVALVQMPVHDLICYVGILTRGSAESFANLPLRKAHLMTEVAQVPAAISPVALAMLALATLILEGAMPIAVYP